LGVKKLTGNFSLNKENTIQIDKEETREFNQGSEKIERTVSTEVQQNIIITEEKEKKPTKVENLKNNVEESNLSDKTEKIKNNSLKNKKSTGNVANIKEKKEKYNYLIQFGAFSKKKNANDLKNSLIKKLNSKFPDFSINVDFDEKRKLYKLISQTNDIEKAKKICGFSKKVKINCLFKKQ
jgi:cell division septation protein DedD